MRAQHVLILLVLCGCKISASSSNKGTPAGPQGLPININGFFGPQDLNQGGQVSPLTPDSLLQDLQSYNRLYANRPKSNDPKSCVDTAIGQQQVRANAAGFVLKIEADFADCANQMLNTSPNASYKITSAPFRMLWLFKCQGLDFSGLDNQPADRLLDANPEASCPNGSSQFESELSLSGTATNSKGTNNYTMHTVTFKGGNNLTFCDSVVANRQVTLNNNCVEIDRMNEDGFEDYHKIAPDGVAFDTNPQVVWPSTGVMNVDHNNWHGTVSYQGQNPPRANFSSQGQPQVTTNLNPVAGLVDEEKGSKGGRDKEGRDKEGRDMVMRLRRVWGLGFR